MADYRVQSTSSRTYTLLAGEAALGELTYPQRLSCKATLVLRSSGTTLHVVPKGFWGTTLEVKQQAEVLLSYRMSWKGSVTLESRLGGESRTLVFKQQSLLKSRYVLLDEEQRELLVIRTHFKWSQGHYEYTLHSTSLFEEMPAKDALLLVTVHCTAYYLTMMAAA